MYSPYSASLHSLAGPLKSYTHPDIKAIFHRQSIGPIVYPFRTCTQQVEDVLNKLKKYKTIPTFQLNLQNLEEGLKKFYIPAHIKNLLKIHPGQSRSFELKLSASWCLPMSRLVHNEEISKNCHIKNIFYFYLNPSLKRFDIWIDSNKTDVPLIGDNKWIKGKKHIEKLSIHILYQLPRAQLKSRRPVRRLAQSKDQRMLLSSIKYLRELKKLEIDLGGQRCDEVNPMTKLDLNFLGKSIKLLIKLQKISLNLNLDWKEDDCEREYSDYKGNEVTKQDIHQFVANFAYLKNLQALNLCLRSFGNNEQKTAFIHSLAKHIKTLHLTGLFLEICDFPIQNKDLEIIANLLKNLKSLESCRLEITHTQSYADEQNSIDVSVLFEGIRQNSNLKRLQLNLLGREINQEGWEAIKISLAQLKKLESLELNLLLHNDMCTKSAKNFKEEIQVFLKKSC